MKYETPELSALTSATNAIQGTKNFDSPADSTPEPPNHEIVGVYQDWE